MLHIYSGAYAIQPGIYEQKLTWSCKRHLNCFNHWQTGCSFWVTVFQTTLTHICHDHAQFFSKLLVNLKFKLLSILIAVSSFLTH